ncbi:hypothetical protein ACJJTC_005485 [Scirpophaga incertulas]
MFRTSSSAVHTGKHRKSREWAINDGVLYPIRSTAYSHAAMRRGYTGEKTAFGTKKNTKKSAAVPYTVFDCIEKRVVKLQQNYSIKLYIQGGKKRWALEGKTKQNQ